MKSISTKIVLLAAILCVGCWAANAEKQMPDTPKNMTIAPVNCWSMKKTHTDPHCTVELYRAEH